MSDVGGKTGSALQSHARTRGPFDGKLFVRLPKIGGANIGDIWVYLRLVRDLVIDKGEGDPETRKESYKGKRVPMENFYPDRDPRIKFTLGEKWDPYNLQLAMGDDTAPVLAEENNAESLIFAMSLQGTKKFDLPVEFNLPTSYPSAAATVNCSAFNGTGSVPDSVAMKYFVAAVSDSGAESVYAVTAESAEITLSAPEDTVQVVWTLASGQVQPDKWRIYRDTSPYNYGSPALIAEVDGSVYSILDGLASPTSGSPNTNPIAVVVKDATESTTYVAGDDYTVDYTEGYIARVSDGAIGNGEMVVITLIYKREASVKLTFDEGRYNSWPVPTMLLGQQQGTRGYTAMVRYTFDQVDWAKGADTLEHFQSIEDAGIELDLPLLFNPTDARFGLFELFDEAIDDFTVIDVTL